MARHKPDLTTRIIFGGVYHLIRLFLKGIYGIFLGTYLLGRAGGRKVLTAKPQRLKAGKRRFLSLRMRRTKPLYESFKILEALQGDYVDFEKSLLESKSKIGIILGARGSGKSAIGMRILENVKSEAKRKTAALGFRRSDIPRWIESVDTLKMIRPGSFVLVDEGGVHFSSRESLSEPNKLLSELLMLARHKDLSILFITQNSSNLEVNTLRQADYLILKPNSLLQKDFERKKIKEIYDEVSDRFNALKKKSPGLAYIYSDEFKGFISHGLPSFWSDRVSKAYRGK